jgi:hypothetical protein
MHTVELLDEALTVAESLGYSIRQEWMGGTGGACEIAGRRWLFVDLALTTDERLDQVVEAIRPDQGLYALRLSPAMSYLLDIHRAA